VALCALFHVLDERVEPEQLAGDVLVRGPLLDNGGVNEPQYPSRLAGRVITIDPAGRALLFRYDDPPPKGSHWATPGGGVEGNEDFYQAACRELVEETGWTDVPVEPTEVYHRAFMQWSANHLGLITQTDHYFIGRVPDELRPLGEVAAMHVTDGIDASRWWTLAELDATDENIYPEILADLVRSALAEQPRYRGTGTPASS
jgi:8-oxo-dGTP pyrophosphatase MutT (NUDIX family)